MRKNGFLALDTAKSSTFDYVKHHLLTVFVFTFLSGLSISAYAQKVEREYNINSSEVPAAAHEFLAKHFPAAKKLRYYLDVSEVDTTIEVKFRIDTRRYSIEFSDIGDWLDTELEISAKEVPEAAWQELCLRYDALYEKWRITRIQKHRGASGAQYFEVEISTRKDFVWDRRQVKLTADGKLLEDVLIKLAPGHLDRW